MKLFEVSLQVVAEDSMDTDKLERLIESYLNKIKISEVFIREVSYVGDFDNDDEEQDEL